LVRTDDRLDARADVVVSVLTWRMIHH